MTPFEELLNAPSVPREWSPQVYRKRGAYPWFLDRASGKVYCTPCAWRAVAGLGITIESVGLKSTTSRKLIGDKPECAKCGNALVGRIPGSKKVKRSGFERATVTFLKELAKMARRR